MTALAAARTVRTEAWQYRQFTLAAGTVAFRGGSACIKLSTGTVVPATTGTDLVPLGVFAENVDATSAAAPVNVRLHKEMQILWRNNDSGTPVVANDLGAACFWLDDQTVTGDSTGHSAAGMVMGVDAAKGVAVSFPDPANELDNSVVLSSTTPTALGVAAAAGSGTTASKVDHVHAWAQKRTVTIDDTVTGSADTNGTASSPIDIGAALPTGAIVVGIELDLATPASGGSVSACAVDVGWSGATTALVKAFDALGSSAGLYDQNDSGSAQDRQLPSMASGKTLQAILTPDVGHKLSALTALGLTINVYYMVAF